MRALLWWSLGSVGLLGVLSAGALHQGLIWFNNPSLAELPVQGLDVSHHQGAIDWNAVAETGRHRFVWIKATEGGDWIDRRFHENWQGAKDAGLAVGAYHFFTFCRPVADQIANYTATVPRAAGALPPALDLEFSGNCSRRPRRDDLLTDIETFMKALEAHYGQRPVLYSTYPFVETYLRGALAGYPLWIRDVYGRPEVVEGRPWTVWQFSSRGRVPGIETFVDENAYAGGEAAFRSLLAGN